MFDCCIFVLKSHYAIGYCRPRNAHLLWMLGCLANLRGLFQVVVTASWLLSLVATGLPAQEVPTSLASGSVRGLPRIAAGTAIDMPDSDRWNRVILLARPRLASGDTQKLPQSIANTVSRFVLTILATVQLDADEAGGERKYQLAEVGLGYSTDVHGELRTVTTADASRLGVSLGIFGRQMLLENEKQLATARLIARTSTLLIFDTPALLLRDEEHRDYVMRHFIWVDPHSGRTAALVWILEQDDNGKMRVVADEPLRWLPPGLKEDRAIHVDGDHFSFLGIPDERAFALEDLPPGKPIPWSAETRALAAETEYTSESLYELTAALNQSLQALSQK